MNTCIHMMKDNQKIQSPRKNDPVKSNNLNIYIMQVQDKQKFEQQKQSRKTKKINKKQKNSKIENKQSQNNEAHEQKKDNWSEDSLEQYFFATLQYFIKYPQRTVSWMQWKPDSFYPTIQAYMNQHLQENNRKTSRQIKPKDQSLKKFYNQNASQPKDLLQVCKQQLQRSVQKYQSKLDKLRQNKLLSDKIYRFKGAIEKFDYVWKQQSKPKQYQDMLDEVCKYTKQFVQKHWMMFDL